MARWAGVLRPYTITMFGLCLAADVRADDLDLTTVHPVVFVESDRPGQAYEAFRRIRADRPLELRLHRPGRVFLSVRALVGGRTRDHVLEFEVARDRVATGTVAVVADAEARFVEPVGWYRPGVRRTFMLKVDAERYPARLTVWLVEGKEMLVGYRYAPPIEDLLRTETSSVTSPSHD